MLVMRANLQHEKVLELEPWRLLTGLRTWKTPKKIQTTNSHQPQQIDNLSGPPTPSTPSVACGRFAFSSSPLSPTSSRSRPSTPADVSTAVKHIIRKVHRGFPFQEVKLASKSLTERDLRGLCTALAGSDSLEILVLAGNPLLMTAGTSHVQSLLLAPGSKLAYLDLSGTGLGSTGVELLASALTQNTALREFNLDGNLLGDQGAIKLSKGLEENETLTALHLRSNCITARGAKALASAIKHNHNYLTLTLGDNPLRNTSEGLEVARNIQTYLKKNMRESTLDTVRECTDFFYDTIQIIDSYVYETTSY